MNQAQKNDPNLKALGSAIFDGNYLQLIDVIRNKAVTSSLTVAKVFGKNHRDVLRAIENHMANIRGVAQICAALSGVKISTNPSDYFRPASYVHPQNKQEYPMYYMNRDGFTLLAMGFDGEKAMQFKLAYIAAFNAMENRLAEIHANHNDSNWWLVREDCKDSFKDLNRVIKDELIPYAVHQGSKHPDRLYVVYASRIKDSSHRIARDNASINQLDIINKMQIIAIIHIRRGIRKGFLYKEIYRQVKAALFSVELEYLAILKQ